MDSVGSIIVYAVIAIAIIVFSVLAVTTRKILRAATYLLFALFATAALYFKLDYEFLGAVLTFLVAGYSLISRCSLWGALPQGENPDMQLIGQTLMGTGHGQYLLPFEAISVLLLACIIGGVVIARKND